MLAHELPCIEQSQSESPHLADVIRIGLVEFLEYLGQLVTGNADAGIGDDHLNRIPRRCTA